MSCNIKQMAFGAVTLCIGLIGCANSGSGESAVKAKAPANAETISIPSFNADSAYEYVRQQTLFGYRIPNTEPHQRTARWLASELERHGAKVTVQDANVTAYDGTILNAKNIIGEFNPENPNRILLLAHWDSRPFADHDPDKANWHKPVMGANDGASGVGVLLEIARNLGQNPAKLGVDILLVDAEDYGTPAFYKGEHDENSWALGTQYWARRPHKPGYTARFGILLDMVGAKDPYFPREAFSDYYASGIVDKIWKQAAQLGYGEYFVNKKGSPINDDHYYVNRMARIPTVDIIHLDRDPDKTFYPYWHTIYDTLDKIDPTTLKMVGETVTNVIYKEK